MLNGNDQRKLRSAKRTRNAKMVNVQVNGNYKGNVFLTLYHSSSFMCKSCNYFKEKLYNFLIGFIIDVDETHAIIIT